MGDNNLLQGTVVSVKGGMPMNTVSKRYQEEEICFTAWHGDSGIGGWVDGSLLSSCAVLEALRNTWLLQTWAAILSTVSLTSPTKDEKPVKIPTRISFKPETLPSASPLSQVTHSKTEFQGWQDAPSIQISLAWPSFLLHSLCFLIFKEYGKNSAIILKWHWYTMGDFSSRMKLNDFCNWFFREPQTF